MSILSAPHFHNEEAAYDFVEAKVWPRGPVCPHCGGVERNSKMQGKSTRIGVYKCYDCRKPFTVKVGTIFESSHIPLRLWLQAIFLIASSKKGISSNQLHRTLGVTLKSAWFMSHRIREAMKDDGGILGGGGGIVEADETFFGNIKGRRRPTKGGGGDHKHKILSLVERDGRTRSFHVANVDHRNLKPILLSQIAKDTHLMTDGAHHYQAIGKEFAEHESVNHTQGEYARKSVRAGIKAHTNTVEGYFGLLKRGLVGTYHHVSEKHLQRYVTEFDFRYSNRVALGVNDVDRAGKLLRGVVGKRLTYKTTAQRGTIQ
jgi:transposase-like protein